jgi:hypothetical protein
MSPPRVALVSMGLFAAVGACGLDLAGTASLSPSSLTDGGPAAGGDAQAGGGGEAGPDDAALAPDVAALPDPAKVTISYGAGKDQTVYAFDADAKTFKALPSAGCPVAEETAVLSDGSVYITSSDNTTLFRLTSTGCAAIRKSASFPYALGTAPVGTVSATEEVLVGYMGAGDYVRVDGATGAVTVIKAGALGALRPSGDVTAFGTRGFLAAASNTGSGSFACASGGDCVVEVDLSTGAPIALLSHLAGFYVYGIAHSRGELLLYAGNGQVYPYDLTTKTMGTALASMPSGANFTGAGAPPYPPP